MHDDLDPPDPLVEPLLVSLGRVILGANALEKILLVDIARRRADDEGLVEQLSIDLTRLEKQPAGVLLQRLTALGLSTNLSERVADAIRRRNLLVHHFMEDLQFAQAAQGQDVDAAVNRIDALAADCQALINEIAPAAFAGVEAVLGADLQTLAQTLSALDPQDIADDALRAQIESAQQLLPKEWLAQPPSGQD